MCPLDHDNEAPYQFSASWTSVPPLWRALSDLPAKAQKNLGARYQFALAVALSGVTE
jgi:hypothetical protein